VIKISEYIQPGYSHYLEIYLSEMPIEELAKVLNRTVEDVELMELHLLNAWVYEDTGEYFEDIPIGPEWLQDIVCDRTEAQSRRMLKVWNKFLTHKLKEKQEK